MKKTVALKYLQVFICGMLLSSCSTSRYPVKSTGEDVIYRTSVTPDYMRRNLYHSVAPGETLWRIAKMYDVDIADIKSANSIQDVTDIEIGTSLYVPGASPRKHVITLYPSEKWKYIIVHHSATDEGNSENFNIAHMRRGWLGVGYHFIIDNGTSGKADGQTDGRSSLQSLRYE
jgi:LysM repeat protein